MADVRLRGVTVRPGGPGWRQVVAEHAREDWFVTSFDDQLLHSVKSANDEGGPDFRSFGDLVGSISRMLGLAERRQATVGQREALMEAVLGRVPKGSWLEASAPHAGTAAALVARLAELRHTGLDAAGLLGASEGAPSGLARRLSDLAWVAAEFESGLLKAGRETLADRIAACLASEVEVPLPFKKLLVLAGPAEADPAAEKFLRWLATRGTDVLIATERPLGGLFGRSGRLRERLGLKEAAKENGAWYDALFREPVKANSPEATFLIAPDVLTECEEAVRWCLEAIAEGVPPHRIGIFARDGEGYGPLLLATARHLGLPLSATISVPVLTSGFARLTLRTLQVLSGSDVRDLGRLASSSYYPSAPESRAELWTLLRDCHAAGDGWESLAQRPTSDTEPWPWLAPLVDWRAAYHLDIATLADWTSRWLELVHDSGLVEAVREPLPSSQRDNHALQVLQRSLAERAGHQGRPMGLRDFAFFCRRVWEAETAVVRFHDARSEQVGQNASLVSMTGQLGDYDALAVVGMVEGSLPRRRRDDPVLGDADRRWLNDNVPGVYLEDSSATAEAERDEFVRVCASASRRIYFSYPASDEDRDNVPTLYLEEARRCLSSPIIDTKVHRGHFAPKPSLCRSPADLALRTCLDDPLPARPVPFLATPGARMLVRPDSESVVLVAEIADASVCPFRAAARHRLGLHSPYSRSSLGVLMAIPRRAQLHVQPDREAAIAAMEVEFERRVAELYPSLETWEVGLLSVAGKRLIRRWAEREFVIRASQSAAVLPEHPEVDIRGKLSIAGNSTYYGETVADIGLIGKDQVPVARIYLSQAVNKSNVADSSIDLRVRLDLMSLAVKTHQAVLEIDSTAENRFLLTLGNPDGKRFKSAPMAVKVAVDDLESADGPDWFRNWCDRTKAIARDALSAVVDGHMRPRPGDHCKQCGYADLCRSAKGQDMDKEAWSSID